MLQQSSTQEVLVRSLSQLTSQIYRACFHLDMQPSHWALLRFVESAPPNAATMRGFADDQGVTAGTASTTIKLLVQKGLISRRRHPRDGRSQVLELTDRGRQLVAQDPLRRLATDLVDAPSEEIATLRNASEILTRVVQAGK